MMRNVIKKTAAVLGSAAVFSLFVFTCGRIYAGIIHSDEILSKIQREKPALETPIEKVYYNREKSYPDMLSEAVKSVVGVSSRDSVKGVGTEYIGSGVLVSEDGYIITNQHVIGARPDCVEVTLSDGETTEGKTLWSNSELDLAVVKIEGTGYNFSPIGDAGSLRVGESVTAIGNPLSLRFERSVTAGIVSALERSIEVEGEKGKVYYMEGLIQTDASINPGNSGGPLLNSEGEIVGINTVKVSNAEGMGFAVPVNVCVPVINRLREDGRFVTPYIGLYAYDKTAARYYKKEADVGDGLFVEKIDSSGPAFKAGLRYGDVIVSVNKKAVSSMNELREEIYNHQSGEKITIEYKRNKNTEKAEVTLDKAP